MKNRNFLLCTYTLKVYFKTNLVKPELRLSQYYIKNDTIKTFLSNKMSLNCESDNYRYIGINERN